MRRPVRSARFPSISAGPPQGYTLVEILVATALTLVMVAAVVQVFGSIGRSISDSRATLEMSDRVRAARTRLEMDLGAVTATMLPPLRPENGEGYFEYIEGPVGPVILPSQVAINTDDSGAPVADTTVGDFDDILMFTTQSAGRPFVGRWLVTGGTIESDVAEVAWFLRGRTLYRRVMLVVPSLDLPVKAVNFSPAGFFADYDISVRWENGNLVVNSLGDLTRRECRYAHWWETATFPYDVRLWGRLGLPTLRECSSGNWVAGKMAPRSVPEDPTDFWNDPHPWANVDKVTGTLANYEGPRVAEDVVLTNVIGFDVKVWDPGAPVLLDNKATLEVDDDVTVAPGEPRYLEGVKARWEVASYGAFVDLGYEVVAYNRAYVPAPGVPAKRFNHVGCLASGLAATAAQPARVYDTWSLHYEHDGQSQDDDDGDGNCPGDPDDPIDEGTNGFDDNGIGGVDDPSEMETSPPYPAPLQAIQVKIRVYEPDSRQIREVTVVQDFLPK